MKLTVARREKGGSHPSRTKHEQEVELLSKKMDRARISKNKAKPANSGNSEGSRVKLNSSVNGTEERAEVSKKCRLGRRDLESYSQGQVSGDPEYQRQTAHDQSDLTHGEIMDSLAETLKRREDQITRSINKEFEISRATMTSTLSAYIDREGEITNKLASEYKHRMDEHADEKLDCLRKLRLGFEKYQLTMFTLLEILDKNHLQNLRARRDFEKDIEHLRSNHKIEISRLHEEIEKSTQKFHKIMGNAAREIHKKPSISRQLKSIFKV
ncbi:18153_t:CDS:2 [Acaulospora morrowiae]|uniref:18153_t:CDS:1 n=1 Tax=Acaulospora morrowiae TaxID=94023 RepID=A0A9N9D689_9GLOM|nr:18153_t:CDS:2 [Acaulospora morrowiae]